MTMNTENKMREIKIEKVILNIGGTGENLEKGIKLLNKITGKKPVKRKSTKRIPTWSVRPGLEVGVMVTIRKDVHKLIERLLVAKENKLKRRNAAMNHISFGVKEYIEIPGMEYQRDIGIMGFDITIVFTRAGRRINLRKLRKAHIPKRQYVSKEEIIKFMEDKFKTQFTGK